MKDFYDQNNKEVDKSFEDIKNSLWDLNLNLANTYIGGFSQGAMMAAKVFFESPKDYKGLISFSGAPLHRNKWNKEYPDSSKKIFLSHGLQDPVLPFQCAKDLDVEITGFNKKTHWFNGQHEIPYQVLSDLANFLTVPGRQT
jgi:predicted esterase